MPIEPLPRSAIFCRQWNSTVSLRGYAADTAPTHRGHPMGLILVIVVVLLLFGGGVGYWGYNRGYYGGRGHGLIWLILVILVLVVLFGGPHYGGAIFICGTVPAGGLRSAELPRPPGREPERNRNDERRTAVPVLFGFILGVIVTIAGAYTY